MSINYDDAGFTRATWGIRQRIKRFFLHRSLTYFLRFSGFFILGIVAYLHFFFGNISRDDDAIIIWMMGYLIYLFLLEYLRRSKFPSYDKGWFVLVRIFSNLIIISWLLYAAPLMRSLLVFAFLVPCISSIVYFPQDKRVLWLSFGSAIVGITVVSTRFEMETPLTLSQTVAMTSVLGIAVVIARVAYESLLSVPESVSGILERMKGTLDLTDIVDQIGVGVSTITGTTELFLLIVDPEYHSYITHKIVGIDLSPSFKMNELIRQCDAIQNGRSYQRDNLDHTVDKEYFQQFFSPPPRAILIEPIIGDKQRVLGLIMVGSSNPSQFDDLRKRYVRDFAHSVSPALETSLLYRQARLSLFSRRSAAEQLLEVEEEIQIMRILVEQASMIGNMDGCVLHRYDRDLGQLIAKAGVRLADTGDLTSWTASSADLGRQESGGMQIGIAWRSMLKREILVANDVRKHPWFVWRPQGQEFISLMTAPIIDPTTQFPLGTLSIYSRQLDAFTTEDQSTLLDLANQGAISIARVQRSEEWRLRGGILKEIFESTLEIDYEAGELVVTQQLANIARRILPFEMIRIRLYDPVTRQLTSVAAAGYPEQDQQDLIGSQFPLSELEMFLKADYRIEKSFLIPADAPGWREFAERYLYIPQTNAFENATWDRYDAFFTPLYSENGELLGYIAWDQPENGIRPTRRIIEVVGAFGSMASWSIDLVRAYRRIAEQRGLIGSLIASTTEKLATSLDSKVMNDVAVKTGSERLGTEACSLYLVVDNQLELASSTYLKNTSYIKRRKQIKAEPGSGLTSWVAGTRKPLYFNSEAEYQNHLGWAGEIAQLQYLPSRSCKNLLIVPIIGHSGNCVGVLSFENKLEDGSIAGFVDADVKTAMSLGEELGLALGLAEQFNNVRTLEQQMLEDDLHELKNHYYYGVQSLADTSMFWLRKRQYKKTESELERLFKNSVTILNELYGLHNTVQRKYYEIEDFRTAVNFLADSLLQVFVGNERNYKEERARILVVCPKDVQIAPLMRYVFIRICSGALMNAILHSGFLADPKITIRISIIEKDGYIQLCVSDNGHGKKRIKPGYGIGRMQDLVRFMARKGFNIKLKLNSNEEKGTEVRLLALLAQKEA